MIFSGAFLAVFVKLFLGAGQYIVQKDVLHYKVSEALGEFQREYFFTAANFLAMLLVVLPLIPGQLRKHQRQLLLPTATPGAAVVDERSVYSWKLVLFSAFPAVLDVGAVLISMKATIFLPASVVVLLKATRVIFAAGLTSVMLKKRVLIHQWMGVLITCVALIPIFFESMEHAALEKQRMTDFGKNKPDEVTTTAEVLQGIGMILAAELMRAVRFVYEEWLIKKQHMATEFLLISECTWGAMAAVLAVVICDAAGGEQLEESWTMFRSSGTLQIMLITYCVAAGICNIAGTFITKFLSSVVNALVSELRVVLVFVPNVIRYQMDKKNADAAHRKVKGEPFDAWSALKILGFALLVLGAYVYNGTVKLPCASLRPPVSGVLASYKLQPAKSDDDVDASGDDASTPRQADDRVAAV